MTDAMAEIEYPGIAKLVGRDIWECRGGIRDGARRNAAKPCHTCVCWISPDCRKRHKSGFDHINDHRQKNLCFSPCHDGMTNNRTSGCSSADRTRGLGPRGREFEPLHSDQKPSEISNFRGLFLSLITAAQNLSCLMLSIYRDDFLGWSPQ